MVRVARNEDLKRELADLIQQSDQLIKSAAKLKLEAEEIQRKAMANDAKRLKPQRRRNESRATKGKTDDR